MKKLSIFPDLGGPVGPAVLVSFGNLDTLGVRESSCTLGGSGCLEGRGVLDSSGALGASGCLGS